MTNQQMKTMFEHPAPEGMHPMVQLLLHPMGMRFTPEMMNDLATFLFDMVGVRLADITPRTIDFHRRWGDDRVVDETIEDAKVTCVWSEQLPPGVSLDPFTGRMVGELPAGDYRWQVRVGPQVKYDALGGTGSPNDEGRWIGVLEEREEIDRGAVDVSSMSSEQRAALRAALDAEEV